MVEFIEEIYLNYSLVGFLNFYNFECVLIDLF